MRDSLAAVADTISTQLVQSIIKMGVQWVTTEGLKTAASVLSVETTKTATVAAAGQVAAASAPAAAATATWSFGTAAVVGLGALVAIYAMSKALSGFKNGGYTGDVGTDDVAGVVHGKEFVLNASATAKHRPMLEAMNRGEDIVKASGGMSTISGGGSKITIVNQTSGKISSVEDRQISPSERVLIIREAVDQAISTASSQFSNPNSKMSKGLRAGFRAEVKR